MAIHFGRDICGELTSAEAREWLITNGTGSYAAGTVAGLLTRRYHGLLLAALKPPLARTLLLTKVDEIVDYDGNTYELATNRWTSGSIAPAGYHLIQDFQLEDSIPCWTYACADALLQKRVWMQTEANTTYIHYTYQRGSVPLSLSIKALVNYRDHHSGTQAGDWHMQIESVAQGVRITAFDGATAWTLSASDGQITPNHEWYQGFNLAQETYRGLSDRDDNLHAATATINLQPGDSFTLVASTEATPNLNGATALADRQAYEQSLRDRWQSAPYLTSTVSQTAPDWIQQLVLAADQFVVRRPLAEEPEGRTVIAGYPWFGDWGRDTMISLTGLTITTGRPEIAGTIIRTFSRYLDQGMLPNVFPEAGAAPEYNTVDAILWYFEAIRAYHAATGDDQLIRDIFPALAEVIDWHRRGTRYNIHLDNDGLIYAGEAGVQLTWMDAKIGDWVITPRIGKPIEISALWYNALQIMAQFAAIVGQPTQDYTQMATQTYTGFQRFWSSDLGYCYDVLDGPDGNETHLRPNQLFAISLPLTGGGDRALLTTEQQRAVVNVCGRALLTSHGMRSLAPSDPDYTGHYGGNSVQRDSVYHQGITWGWVLGPYIEAHWRVYQDKDQALLLMQPMADHLMAHGLGSISEIFDGDPPFNPRGCFAQAWSVAEMLRVWTTIQS